MTMASVAIFRAPICSVEWTSTYLPVLGKKERRQLRPLLTRPDPRRLLYRGLMEQDNMDNLGFKDLDPPSSGTSNDAADRAVSQGRNAHTGSIPRYAGDTHGAEGNVPSSKAGSGSPIDERNRGEGAGSAHAKGQVSRQAGSYAGDSHGRTGGGRLV